MARSCAKCVGSATSVPPKALRLINDQEALILDVRDGGEYKEGHIPQARHIPLVLCATDWANRPRPRISPSSSIVA